MTVQEVGIPSSKGCHQEVPLHWNEALHFVMAVPHPKDLHHPAPWAGVSVGTLLKAVLFFSYNSCYNLMVVCFLLIFDQLFVFSSAFSSPHVKGQRSLWSSTPKRLHVQEGRLSVTEGWPLQRQVGNLSLVYFFIIKRWCIWFLKIIVVVV